MVMAKAKKTNNLLRKTYKSGSGESGRYVQRAQALRRLQVSLADFRRLCILKGVFPRQPRKKLAGRDRVYYHTKDIQHLACEPLLNKFREEKVVAKRMAKALARHDILKAKRCADQEREAGADIESQDLSRILLERYPTLLHAVRDLDDAVSCVALFASLPASNAAKITPDIIFRCQKLLNEFLLITSHKNCISAVFASVKGYYVEFSILNEKLVSLFPHEFSTQPSKQVDLKVMSTFLTLYLALLQFVVYKLYSLSDFAYPPKALTQTKNLTLPHCPFMRLSLKPLTADPSANAPANSSDNSSENTSENSPESPSEHRTVEDIGPKRTAFGRDTLFKDQVFYLSRETPVGRLVPMLRSCGARVVGFDETRLSDEALRFSPIEERDLSVTHHVCDRPASSFDALLKRLTPEVAQTRSFVQPQWIFDCINVNAQLPTAPYKTGVAPPPHLSPFDADAQDVDDREEKEDAEAVPRHVPEQRLTLKQWAREADARRRAQPASEVPVLSSALTNATKVASSKQEKKERATVRNAHHGGKEEKTENECANKTEQEGPRREGVKGSSAAKSPALSKDVEEEMAHDEVRAVLSNKDVSQLRDSKARKLQKLEKERAVTTLSRKKREMVRRIDARKEKETVKVQRLKSRAKK